MTPPTHWQRLRYKLYAGSTVWLGYISIAGGYFLDVLPDILTILNDPGLSAAVAVKVGILPIYMKGVGVLTIVCRLRKQILAVIKGMPS